MKNHGKTNKVQNESGIVLIAVLCLTAVAAILAAGLLTESSSQLKIAGRNVNLEQAFYTAEAGAERAVSYIQQVGTISAATCITGSIGNGTYATFIIPSSGVGAGGANTLSGSLNINPNNSPNNEFLLIKPDGTSITRDDLNNDTTAYDSEPCVYYSGPAMLIHVKPMGAGNQNTLLVNGVVYPLNNSTTYDFAGNINVVVQTDNRNNGNNRAVPPWRLESINGNGVTLFDSSVPVPAISQYEVRSIGAVQSAKRTVIMEGVRQDTWARFALWFDHSGGPIYFIGGEVMNGPVHSNTNIFLLNNPVFNALVTSAATNWGQWSAAAVFNMGFQLSAPRETMASVNFANLLSNATMVITGGSSVTLSGGTNTLISNPDRGWVNSNYTLVGSNSLIYVRTSGTNIGTVNVEGTNLDGRLTIVADNNIHITNHISYTANPSNGPSDDALGLIAQNNVVVMTNAPNNLNIFAHIISCSTVTNYSAGFYVTNYNVGSARGTLTVYGGIVQNNRGAVGTTAPTGFRKNYIYDARFVTDPPPQYPTLTNAYIWSNWRETP